MKKVMTSETAAGLIKDGDTVAICGQGSMLIADEVLRAIESRYLTTGSPRDLTVIEPCNAGMKKATGIERLAHVGLLRRVIASAFPVWDEPRLASMIMNGEIEGYNLPMGVLYHLMRDIAAGRPGLITDVGLHTFVDPRVEGGRLNSRSTDQLCRLLEIEGKEYLLFPAIRLDVSIIRGTTADETGNISMEREATPLGVQALALAAHNSCGRVIAQVERLNARFNQDAKSVVVPGHFVDAIVVDPNQEQSAEAGYNPYITGELRKPCTRTPVPSGPENVILRRAILELQRGDLVNLGVGVPSYIPAMLVEIGAEDYVVFSTEHGGFGGIPAPLPLFGAHINPEAVLDTTAVFDLYDGGGLDIAFLGLAQADAEGNINVSKFGNVLPGCGGFIDITNRTKRLVFCGMFTAKGTKVELLNGNIKVLKEGKVRKFVKQVDQITLKGKAAIAKGQEVTVITERCVMKLSPEGWQLTEYSTGIDISRDLILAMEFEVKPAPGCTRSPSSIYDMTEKGCKDFKDFFKAKMEDQVIVSKQKGI